MYECTRKFWYYWGRPHNKYPLFLACLCWIHRRLCFICMTVSNTWWAFDTHIAVLSVSKFQCGHWHLYELNSLLMWAIIVGIYDEVVGSLGDSNVHWFYIFVAHTWFLILYSKIFELLWYWWYHNFSSINPSFICNAITHISCICNGLCSRPKWLLIIRNILNLIPYI